MIKDIKEMQKHVRQMWKTSRAYIICCDHNRVTGNETKKCNFFDELEEIFGRDDNIQPLPLCRNLSGIVKRKGAERKERESEQDEDSEGIAPSEGLEFVKPRRKSTK